MATKTVGFRPPSGSRLDQSPYRPPCAQRAATPPPFNLRVESEPLLGTEKSAKIARRVFKGLAPLPEQSVEKEVPPLAIPAAPKSSLADILRKHKISEIEQKLETEMSSAVPESKAGELDRLLRIYRLKELLRQFE